MTTQGHSLTVVQGHSDSTFTIFFSSETVRPIEGLTPQMKITHCLIIYKSKNKYPGHTSGNTAAFHPVI